MRKREARQMTLARWTGYCAYLARVRVLPTLAYAKQIAKRDSLSPEQKAQVEGMIAQLDDIARLFGARITYRLVPKLERANQRFAAALITLCADRPVGPDAVADWLGSEPCPRPAGRVFGQLLSSSGPTVC